MDEQLHNMQSTFLILTPNSTSLIPTLTLFPPHSFPQHSPRWMVVEEANCQEPKYLRGAQLSCEKPANTTPIPNCGKLKLNAPFALASFLASVSDRDRVESGRKEKEGKAQREVSVATCKQQ